MRANGLGLLVSGPPTLCPLAHQARHCWIWCDGWAPERWPLYAALYPVADWLQLIEMMEHIRRGQQSEN